MKVLLLLAVVGLSRADSVTFSLEPSFPSQGRTLQGLLSSMRQATAGVEGATEGKEPAPETTLPGTVMSSPHTAEKTMQTLKEEPKGDLATTGIPNVSTPSNDIISTPAVEKTSEHKPAPSKTSTEHTRQQEVMTSQMMTTGAPVLTEHLPTPLAMAAGPGKSEAKEIETPPEKPKPLETTTAAVEPPVVTTQKAEEKIEETTPATTTMPAKISEKPTAKPEGPEEKLTTKPEEPEEKPTTKVETPSTVKPEPKPTTPAAIPPTTVPVTIRTTAKPGGLPGNATKPTTKKPGSSATKLGSGVLMVCLSILLGMFL